MELLNHRRIGFRRGIEVIGAADVVVFPGRLHGRVARQRQPIKLVLEDRVHALEVVNASPQSPPRGCSHALGRVGLAQPQNSRHDRVGVIDGRKPLEEVVQELLRVRTGGRLVPYPPPA